MYKVSGNTNIGYAVELGTGMQIIQGKIVGDYSIVGAGAVVVKDDVVISTGYNGAPRGFENCCNIGNCPRMDRNMHQGEGYGMCRAIHAEANALLNCSRQQTIGADLYLVGVNPNDNSIHEAKPCPLCARLIIQAGIRNVYLRVGEGADNYVVVPATDLVWVQEGGE